MHSNEIPVFRWELARHFLYQLSISAHANKFPGAYIIERNREVRMRLFAEFCQTPRTPAFHLYVEGNTTSEQRRQGLGPHGYTPAYETVLNQLRQEFNELEFNARYKRIPIANNYLTHSLYSTPLVLLLEKVWGQYSGLLTSIAKLEDTPDNRIKSRDELAPLFHQLTNYCSENNWPQSSTNALLDSTLDMIVSNEEITNYSDASAKSVNKISSSLFEQLITKQKLVPANQDTIINSEERRKQDTSTKSKGYDSPFIIITKQEAIFKTLKPYINPDQYDALKSVLDGKHIEGRIWVKTGTNSLGYAFKQKLPDVSMKQVSFWLAKYFSTGETTEKIVSQQSVYDVLRGKNPVPTQKQLR